MTTRPARPSARRGVRAALIPLIVVGVACLPSGADGPSPDWPVYQGQGSNQYSPLDQITRDNVDQLEVAWTFRSGDASPDGRSQIQCNPIIVAYGGRAHRSACRGESPVDRSDDPCGDRDGG